MASRGVNKVIILGNISSDLDLKYMPNGKAALNFSVATSEVWKDQQTQQQKEDTEFHRCVAFDKQAEIINQYMQKGKKIYIEGSLKTRKYQDKNGVDRYTTEVRVKDFQFVEKANNTGHQQNNYQQQPQQQGYQQQQNGQQQYQQRAPQNNQSQHGQAQVNNGYPDGFNDEIPL